MGVLNPGNEHDSSEVNVKVNAKMETENDDDHDVNLIGTINATVNEEVTSEPDGKSSCCNRTSAFLIKWHLPIMLVTGLLLGYAYPPPGKFLGEADLGGICFPTGDTETCVYNSVSNLCITLIFVMSGMKLKTEEIKRALRTWKAALFGFISILFITPCVSFVVVRVDFAIPEFAAGLALFFAQATTLSSGAIITGQAKGNIALALLLTVSTNIIGVFTMPLFVSSCLDYYVEKNTHLSSNNQTSADEDVNINVDPVPIIIKLIFAILIPLAIGKLLRNFTGVQVFATKYGKKMKLLASFLLASIVWMKVSSSADDLNSLDFVSILAVFFAGIVVHLVFLIFNYGVAAYAMKLHQPERRAVVIVSSQKTLPVAITVLDILPNSILGSPGLVAVPIIAAHFVQIVMDAFIAAYWAELPLESDQDKDKPEVNTDNNDSNDRTDSIGTETGKQELASA